MFIRRLEKDDARSLQACRLLGLEESPEAFLAARDEVAGTPLAVVESELSDPEIRYLGAFSGDDLVGFMRFVRFRRRSRRHVAEVRSVYVKSVVRGQGVGARLLRRLVEEARAEGIESLILSVLEDNVGARRLYEGCGFRPYGIEPRAVRRGSGYVGQALYSLDVAACPAA
jgi:ribosomal protein S18 acetylase RimI-like enzyme